MLLQAAAFYLFAGVTIAAALMTISARNPVHAVLFLILAFISAAGLFLLAGAEFLALLLVVVYVGAVAVLFLFVVMMLDIDFAALREGFLAYLPLGALIGLVLLAELLIVVLGQAAENLVPAGEARTFAELGPVENARVLGDLIYTQYVYAFQMAGLTLLVAMVGAITLTLRRRSGVRRQNVGEQVNRKREKAVTMVDIKPGQGG
jgi:NADH-quinone oxidoreductase subunit J